MIFGNSSTFGVIFVSLASVFVTLALPGPSLVAVASSALKKGRESGFFVAGGISAGVLIWVILVAIGLGAVLNVFPFMLIVLKLFGGSYFVWLSYKSFAAVQRRRQLVFEVASDELNAWASFRYGMLIVLSNPAAALMWSAVASFLFGSGLTSWQMVMLSPFFSLAAFLVYAGYAVLFSTGTAITTYQRFSRITETVFGGIFGVLGGSLMLSGISEIRGT